MGESLRGVIKRDAKYLRQQGISPEKIVDSLDAIINFALNTNHA